MQDKYIVNILALNFVQDTSPPRDLLDTWYPGNLCFNSTLTPLFVAIYGFPSDHGDPNGLDES